MVAKPIERFVIRHWPGLWLHWRLWGIWTPWLNWLPFRLWRGWRTRHQKAMVSGFDGIATKCDMRPQPAPDGTFRWLPDQYIGSADVFEDTWPQSQ